MQYKANSPEEYILQPPGERQPVISKIRGIINKKIPKGFKEQMSYGMLGWVVPHSLYPDILMDTIVTRNCRYRS